MKKALVNYAVIAAIIISAVFIGCKKEEPEGPDHNNNGVWTRKADFPAENRAYGAVFSIGNKGYISASYRIENPVEFVYHGFWEYNPVSNSWTQKADFAGSSTQYEVGFSIGNKGYVGLGNYLDFWEYDPVSNSWTQKADYPGLCTGGTVGFSIGNKGYVGTGSGWFPDIGNTYVKDFWEYDPISDSWTQKADFAGGDRAYALGFSIGSKGYIGLGWGTGSWDYPIDFWEYDPVLDLWTQKADFPSVSRFGSGVGLSIGNKGYIGLGSHDSFQFRKDFGEYDPASNTWTRKADFPGEDRYVAIGFSIGNKGYIGLGGFYSNDFWEFTP